MASTEYIEFVYMMLEFKVRQFEMSWGCVRVRKTGTAKITNMRRVKLISMGVRMLKRVRAIRLEDDSTKA